MLMINCSFIIFLSYMIYDRLSYYLSKLLARHEASFGTLKLLILGIVEKAKIISEELASVGPNPAGVWPRFRAHWIFIDFHPAGKQKSVC